MEVRDIEWFRAFGDSILSLETSRINFRHRSGFRSIGGAPAIRIDSCDLLGILRNLSAIAFDSQECAIRMTTPEITVSIRGLQGTIFELGELSTPMGKCSVRCHQGLGL